MVIDFHSHILPKVDDGSSSVDMSIEMLRMEAKQGIKQVVLTPHFYAHHDTPKKFLERRKNAETQLQEEMKKHEGLPEILVGAEVYYFSGMCESDCLYDLTIEGTNYILIEMPFSTWTEKMYEELYKIHTNKGLTPILAHVDRYISPFKTYQIPERLQELPVLVQVNASFFESRVTRRMAMRMLKENKIHLLGSDCHNITDRKPNIGMALAIIEKQLGLEKLKEIQLYGERILHFE